MVEIIIQAQTKESEEIINEVLKSDIIVEFLQARDKVPINQILDFIIYTSAMELNEEAWVLGKDLAVAMLEIYPKLG